ncbi:sigma D regulator [Alteromonas sp. CYL-A6]|uniref:sigma D regulator n=1 Tax=Alteromonas nitratireducens TaxID=3390813 RepID=UPI0034C3447A
MLKQLESVKSKWGGKSETVDNWLKARQQLLIQYCELAGVTGVAGPDSEMSHGTKSTALPDIADIEAFCESLMDYLSAGHFEVYDMLAETSSKAKALKEQLYPQLAKTTDEALGFNDRYTQLVDAQQAAAFDADLEKLGETLEDRFELEDRLVRHLYEVTLSDASA